MACISAFRSRLSAAVQPSCSGCRKYTSNNSFVPYFSSLRSCSSRPPIKTFRVPKPTTQPPSYQAPLSEDNLLARIQLHDAHVPDDTVTYKESDAEFVHVLRLLPQRLVPPPPAKNTPSGWVPQNENLYKKWPYFVKRTRNHMLPLYLEQPEFHFKFPNLKMTTITKVQGDIWALERDLVSYLKEVTGRPFIATQVQEISRKVRLKGIFDKHVLTFLLERGF